MMARIAALLVIASQLLLVWMVLAPTGRWLRKRNLPPSRSSFTRELA